MKRESLILSRREKTKVARAGAALLMLAWFGGHQVLAQTHDHAQHHGQGEQHETAIKPPRVFLDKSRRIVEYQLKRLDNERLLLVERKTDDPKYVPVFEAILSRAGMSPLHREEALERLVQLNNSDAPTELLSALAHLNPDDRQERRTSRQLAKMLLSQPATDLSKASGRLKEALDASNELLRPIAYAGLIAAGRAEEAASLASATEQATLDWLAGVSLVPNAEIRSSLRDRVVKRLAETESLNIRRAAIASLASIPKARQDTFARLAPLVFKPKLRDAAVRTLLSIPKDKRDPQTSRQLAEFFVKLAEETPADGRTTDDFIAAMQLTDQLLALVSTDVARSLRQRLREVTVRVVVIHTVEEEMRYDLGYFAVEAGRPVQVILKNEDLMPHNWVLTVPGALKEVAQLGLEVGPTGGYQGKQYVPESEKVLQAMQMVQPRKQERLTFDAPEKPGEYPYVCTFPRHWMRMYGVMIVVDDLDAWLKNPTEPKDPVGSNRPFVKAWTLNDLKGDLESGLRGRTLEIGQRIFAEASCAQCHKVKGQGGSVGPELTEVFKRWKGDSAAVLQEVLDPSHRIDPKYAVHLILTTEGQTLSGIVTAQDKDSISVLVNPEAKEPTVVKRSDIEEMVKTSASMMPKALLDRFTKDEIFELIAYLRQANPGS